MIFGLNGSSNTETKIEITQQELLEIIDLKPFNKLMMPSVATKLSPLPRPATSLQGKQRFMYSLDTTHRKFQSHQRKSFSINEN